MNNEIIQACKNSKSMMQAAQKVNIPYTTFKRKAIKLNVWKTNQGGKGYKKTKITLDDILTNKIWVSSLNIKKRLLEANIKKYKCEQCGISKWLKKKLTLELHHKDGNTKNNNLDNLELLCPNCHSQTLNFRK